VVFHQTLFKVAAVLLSTNNNLARNSLIKLYPNPATDYLIIDTGKDNMDIA